MPMDAGDGTVRFVRRRSVAISQLEPVGIALAVGGAGEMIRSRRFAEGVVRSVNETIVYEVGREQYAPLLLAHPEWLDELAAVMAERLARRMTRITELDAGSRPQPLLERIRRNFFG